MINGFTRISPSDRPDYRDLISDVSKAVWPEFMLHDPVADEHWDGLFANFAAFQFALVHDESGAVAGIANSVPLSWELTVDDLPDEGWDWALIKSASDRRMGEAPNVLCALQISVSPGFQGHGLSSVFISEMVELARSAGLPKVIVPVRPRKKDKYPLASIDSYVTWVGDKGLPYDPWLRVHVRNGGRIVKPCPLAMRIVGTVHEWEQWTGLRFFESGEYVVPGALVPVTMELSQDIGTYLEPNVWVVHEVIRI